MLDPDLPLSTTLEVRDRCLCLHTQRAARELARLFDAALRPAGLTNGQFSLLMALNRPEAPRIADLAPLLGMDRTTLTAALKPLQRRGLVVAAPDRDDRRSRRLTLTDTGRAALKAALPAWRATHDALDARLALPDPAQLRHALDAVAGRGAPG
ncbi:MarR family winged helix-turn-helix transcriptional regulator [Roseicyclus persicicus]|uniref:Winged helix-turn-helix transcriptional regulator n=1 Tax=Roseicyclus persicicus TaxID=2650661 RepID=A0A7X6K119_9RHOB|nr:MarR family winged helix-turn-helix transcriptional regulator [Roseibacterium persicicum]NKX46453.1 winged helix-turn-helix transcriptional regulator [Roseibacterium persicicum]